MGSKRFRGDILGAGAAAVVTIPLSIAYGLLAFAPLGSEFAAQAALIGVLSAFITGFTASLLGSTSILITAPTAPLTLVMSSITAGLVVSPFLSHIPSRESFILALLALTVFTAGIVQIVFGSLRLGNLVKYVPYPVMAGFMNGIALLLILKQIRPLMGIDYGISLIGMVQRPGIINPLTLLIGMATIAIIFLSRRMSRSLPGSFVGLLGGTLLYYSIRAITGSSSVIPTIGKIDLGGIKPVAFQSLLKQVGGLDLVPLFPGLFVAGIMIGLVGSMESLFCTVLSDDLTGSTSKSNRELIGQGAGNTLVALFAGLPGAGSIPKTMSNYRAGGRTRLSRVLSSILVLLIVGVLGPLISIIPLAVFSAIVVAIGIDMVDDWTVLLIRQLPRERLHRKSIIANLSITLTVTVIMISVNLVLAIGLGIAIASILFISKMGRSVVRRSYFGDQLHSKRARSWEDREVLEREGKKIVVFDLQGPIFFGSGENLARNIQNSMKDASYCILDLKRVSEIDSTGARIIVRAAKHLRKENKQVLLSYFPAGGPLRSFLAILGFEKEFGEERIFQDTDTALEWAENDLLKTADRLPMVEKVDLNRMNFFSIFTEEEIELLTERMSCRECLPGDKIIGNVDGGRDLFFLTRGSVSIRIPLSEDGRTKRLVTYSAGAIFGEMAFLDGVARSAEVSCDSDSEVYTLSYRDFESICTEQPELGLKFMKSIAVEITRRLRLTSQEVGFLEEF